MSKVEPREVAVRKYFTETPPPVKASYHGILLILAIIAVGWGLLFVSEFARRLAAQIGLGEIGGWGFLLIFVGALFAWQGLVIWGKNSSAKAKYSQAFQNAEPKPSDQEMDAWLESDTRLLAKESLTKLDLMTDQIINENKEPITVIGPSRGADLAVGEDGVIRFSKYDLVLVYLTEYHLAAYKGTLDMAMGTTTSESTQEYHYTDVVSVATQTEGSDVFAVMVNGEKKAVNSFQKFALSVASGERIEVVIGFPQLSDIVKEGKLLPTGADKAISVIRSRLREKKGGVQA